MADYQYRTYGETVASTRSEAKLSPILGWTNSDNASGSLTTSLAFTNYYDKVGGNQRVTVNYNPTWKITWDKNNRMVITVSGVVKSITATTNGKSKEVREIVIRNYRNGAIAKKFKYYDNNSGTLSGQFSVQSTSFTVNPGATSPTSNMLWLSSYAANYSSEGKNSAFNDNFNWGLQFKNTRAWIYDNPVINSTTCAPSPSEGSATISVTADFGATRPSSGGTVTVEFYKDENHLNLAKTVSYTGNTQVFNQTNTVTGLQPNTKYYVRYIASNGNKTAVDTCEFVTLATNSIVDVAHPTATNATAKLIVNNGGSFYAPSTKVEYKKCKDSAWTTLTTTTTRTTANLSLTGLESNTCYQIRAVTTTTAGVYTGSIVSFTTPDQKLATGTFTSIDSAFQDDGYYVKSDICYEYESKITPVNVKVNYRLSGESEWTLADEEDFTTGAGQYCFTLNDLFPNLVEYELQIVTENADGVWESDITKFKTPLMENPYNYICDNLEYLLDLLCQAIEPLKNGNKTIYVNPVTKENCDPYSENPTHATLWSRILRFNHAAACVLCIMEEQKLIGTGDEDQYLVGETGWTTILQTIEEGADGLVSSKAVKDYIEKELEKVWHFQDSVTYLVGKVDELPTDAEENESAIVTENSKRYVYNGTEWIEDTDFETSNFSVFHIIKGYDSSIGDVKQGSAWFYFEGGWSNLDADTRDLERRIELLENFIPVLEQDSGEDPIEIRIVTADFDFSTLPQNKRVICYVIEDK